MTETPSTMPIPDYTYTTYIGATAEDVWTALTDRDRSARFWGHSQVSDWRVGSRVEHVRTDGSGIADAAGTVVAVERPRRLSFGFDDPANADRPVAEQTLATFDIEPYRDIVKLTLTQSNLPSTEELDAIADGWPAVIANLKTMLETGAPLPTEPWSFHAEERAARMAAHD